MPQDYLVSYFSLPIGLKVFHRCHTMLNTEVTQETIELLVCEL